LRSSLRDLITRHRAYVIASELVFTSGFALMAWIRSFTPAVVDTEKFMDVAFLSSLWRTPHLPPPDPWLSGTTINYYYYGHFLLATIAKTLGTQPGTAFNLGIALIFGLAAVAIFGVSSNLIATLRGGILQGPAVILTGITSAILVLVLGNLNGAQVWWQDALTASQRSFAGITTPWAWWLHRDLWLGYDWWPPSRVIPGTITEFPAFSFVLADLHAHVLALPFAALSVGVALNLLLAHGVGVRAFGRGWPGMLALASTAVALGSLYAINGWDLPTYLALALLALTLQQWLAHDCRLDTLFLLDLFSAGVLLVALAFLAYLPFYRGFVSPSQGISPVVPTDRTPIGYEFAIFGLPLFILGSLLVVWLARRANVHSQDDTTLHPQRPIDWRPLALGAALTLLLLWTVTTQSNRGWTLIWCLLIILASAWLIIQRLDWLTDYDEEDALSETVPPVPFVVAEPVNVTPTATISPDPNPRRRVSRLSAAKPSGAVPTAGSSSTAGLPTDASTRAEMLLLVLFGTAAALVAACELIFLRDIFSSRMNTVFKLYFQAWLLLGIAAGPALVLLLGMARTHLRAALASVLSLSRETPSTQSATTGAPALGQTTLALAPQPASILTRLTFATSHAQTDANPPSEQASTNDEVEESPDPNPRRRVSRRAAPSGAVSTAGSPVSTARPHFPVPNLPLALRWLGAAGILIWGMLLVILIAAAAIYPLLATSARTNNFTSPARTLDGTAYTATDPALAPASCTDVGAGSNAHDDEAIAWLNTHMPGEAVIVEAPGCEWTHYSRVSAFTGLPTLLGWPGGHEGEWRINWLPQHPEVDSTFGDRLNAINQIYTDPNQDAVIALLDRYHARLIYVGAAERALYPTADMRRFSAFMCVIYTRDGVTIYELP
ncbi:MAG: DUF2298 domain-containing protein, partial [Ktedonobacterales bacterium]